MFSQLALGIPVIRLAILFKYLMGKYETHIGAHKVDEWHRQRIENQRPDPYFPSDSTNSDPSCKHSDKCKKPLAKEAGCGTNVSVFQWSDLCLELEDRFIGMKLRLKYWLTDLWTIKPTRGAVTILANDSQDA